MARAVPLEDVAFLRGLRLSVSLRALFLRPCRRAARPAARKAGGRRPDVDPQAVPQPSGRLRRDRRAWPHAAPGAGIPGQPHQSRHRRLRDRSPGLPAHRRDRRRIAGWATMQARPAQSVFNCGAERLRAARIIEQGLDSQDAFDNDRQWLCRAGFRRVPRRFRPRRRLRRQGRDQDRGAEGGRDPDLRAGPRRACREQCARSAGCPSRPTCRRPSRRPRWSSSPSARRRGAATATPTSPMSMPRRATIAAALNGLHRRRHQIDRAGRHRRRGRADHPRGQSGRRCRRRLQPGIPARRRGDRRFQAPRPHRHRPRRTSARGR